MGRGKGPRKPKGEFDDLDEIFKSEVQAVAGDHDKLRTIISKNAVNLEVQVDAMKKDPDVKEASDKLKEAKRPYVDGIKFCKKRIRFCRQAAKDIGRPLPGTEE